MLSQTPLPNICPACETTAGQIRQTEPKPQYTKYTVHTNPAPCHPNMTAECLDGTIKRPLLFCGTFLNKNIQMCAAVCVLQTYFFLPKYVSATYSYYSILFIPNVAHARSETFTALRFLCHRLHFLASFFLLPLALCVAVCPCVCYQAVSV